MTSTIAWAGRPGAPVAFRWGALTALFLLELGGLSVAYNAPEGADHAGLIGRVLGSADGLLQFGIGLMAILVLYIGSRDGLMAELSASQTNHRWRPWLAMHTVAFGVFWLVSGRLFGGARVESISFAWFAAWIAAGIATVVFLLFCAVPRRTWSEVLIRERSGLLLCAFAGAAVWVGGHVARSLWRPLASLTLTGAYRLLTLAYPDAYYSSEGVLGTSSFSVVIAPQCSGYEGIWLVIAFGAFYLWLFRGVLRFPAALALLPIGIVGMLAANIVRVAALIVVGTSISPELAIQGFHSQAGWIGFSLIALGLVAVSHRMFHAAPAMSPARPTDAGFLATPLLVPFLALTAATMICNAFSTGFNAFYPVGVVASGGALWYFRRSYVGMMSRPSWEAPLIGIAVFAMWVAMEGRDSAAAPAIPAHLAGWPIGVAAGWIAFRLIGSVVTVPIVEELAFRGYVIRKLGGAGTSGVAAVKFTWLSLIGSSLLFGVLHGRWVAGTLAGIGFACAAYRRGRLGDAVVAHMTTNALIGALVLTQGRWSFWS